MLHRGCEHRSGEQPSFRAHHEGLSPPPGHLHLLRTQAGVTTGILSLVHCTSPRAKEPGPRLAPALQGVLAGGRDGQGDRRRRGIRGLGRVGSSRPRAGSSADPPRPGAGRTPHEETEARETGGLPGAGATDEPRTQLAGSAEVLCVGFRRILRRTPSRL